MEAVRRILDYLHKDNPKELQANYDKLNTAIKNGAISKLDDAPQQLVQQENKRLKSSLLNHKTKIRGDDAR